MNTKATPLAVALAGCLLAFQTPSANAADAAGAEAAPSLPGRLDLHLRTYAESLQIINGSRRHAIIQSGRLVYQSDYYGGGNGNGLGFDVGAYGALRLDGGGGVRNMAHYLPDGTGGHDDGWAYLGEYALKAKLGGTVAKVGVHTVSNPFMQPYDIRSLPPTFRGVSVVSTDVPGVTLQAGSFDGAIPRGDGKVRPLTMSYTGLPFDRISYVGASAELANSSLALFGSQATDLWNQYYLSANHRLNFDGDFHLTGQVDAYLSRGTGARHAGDVHNDAVSLALIAQKGPHSVLMGYQTIRGDEFMDYVGETAGVYLTNAMGVDYNSPHERSVQLRYTFNGSRAGIPGWTLMAWTVQSHGVDASAQAAAHADPNDFLHDLYWKNGAYARGSRHEYAVKNTYILQEGRFKGTKIAFYVYRTRVDDLYPSKSFNDMQLMINYPMRVF